MIKTKLGKTRIKGASSLVLSDLTCVVKAVTRCFTEAGMSDAVAKKLVLFAVENGFLPEENLEAVLSEKAANFIRDISEEAAND